MSSARNGVNASQVSDRSTPGLVTGTRDRPLGLSRRCPGVSEKHTARLCLLPVRVRLVAAFLIRGALLIKGSVVQPVGRWRKDFCREIRERSDRVTKNLGGAGGVATCADGPVSNDRSIRDEVGV